MAHFAELDDSIVLRVIRVDDANEEDGENWCHEFAGGNWKQTSYNSTIRHNYAGVGYTYDAENDAFFAPKPFPSWSLDDAYLWQPPTPRPDDGKRYEWDEDTLAWVEIE